MSKRDHKELWEQLRVVIIFSKQAQYTKKELYELMCNLELSQLAQDPFALILETVGPLEESK